MTCTYVIVLASYKFYFPCNLMFRFLSIFITWSMWEVSHTVRSFEAAG